MPVGDDNVNAESRASELQHFKKLERRIYDLTRLNPLWVHKGYAIAENYYDDAPEYVLQIRDLIKERDVVIQNLQKFGITPRDAETIGAQLWEQWDVSRNIELAQIAGISSPSTIAKPTRPGRESRNFGPGERAPRVRRSRNRELKPREKDILQVIKRAVKVGYRGMMYCLALETKKIPPPREWTNEGCPTTYPEAYKHAKWKHRIQDEKCRLSQFLPKKRTRHFSPTSGTRRKRVNH